MDSSRSSRACHLFATVVPSPPSGLCFNPDAFALVTHELQGPSLLHVGETVTFLLPQRYATVKSAELGAEWNPASINLLLDNGGAKAQA